MLTIYVLDQSAEARNRLINHISQSLELDPQDQLLLPRINIKPVSKQELKFCSAPDILIIGEEIASSEMGVIASVKKLIPTAAILVKVIPSMNTLLNVEHMARLGVDDIYSETTSAAEFVRKIVLLGRKSAGAKSGKLILIESGKGGLGVTSIAAALADVISANDKKVVLVDLDFDTQDLSRFLQVRPFINENLELLLKEQRPLSEEAVRQCLVPVLDEDDSLFCMPPAADSDAAYDPRSMISRVIISVLEYLDGMFDCVVVDSGGARGSLIRSLYRVADKVVFVTSNDPACLYSSVDKIARIKAHIAVNAEIILVENNRLRHALPRSVLRDEMIRAAKLPSGAWFTEAIPFSSGAANWPGSGRTPAACGGKTFEVVMQQLAARLEILQAQPRTSRSGLRAADEIKKVFNKARLMLAGRKKLAREAVAIKLAAPQAALPAPESLVSKATATPQRRDYGNTQKTDLLAPHSGFVQHGVKARKESNEIAEQLVSHAKVGNGSQY